MPKVIFQDKTYICNPEKSLLDNILGQGGLIPYSCMQGICHACLVHAVQGSPPVESQQGLDASRKKQGCFLACQCKVTSDMQVELPPQVLQKSFRAQLVAKKQLSHHVFLLSFQCPIAFEYHAGQFVNIIHPESKQIRSYSTSSTPNEGYLQFHIKHIPQGHLSNWLCTQIKLGDEINFKGPFGHCYYNHDQVNKHQPLILAGVGTGLSPLYGILKDALLAKHQGHIYFFHASLDQEGLYFHNTLNKLAKENPCLSYIACVLSEKAPEGGKQGAIAQIIIDTLDHCNGKRAYLCGDDAVVKSIKTTLLAHGIAQNNILADPFIAAK